MKIRKMTKIFKALGNERRLLILKNLFREKELTVSQISSLIKLSFKSVSKHLSILENANLIKSRRVGFNKLYSVEKNISKELIRLLNQYFK